MAEIKYIIIFAVLIFTCYCLTAQTEDNILQNLEDVQSSGDDVQRLLESIEQRNNNLTNIYNINQMSREDMIILGLNNFQIFSLENYIRRSGQLLSVGELRFVNGFDSITVSKIAPFVIAEPVKAEHPLKWDSIFANSKQNIRFQYAENLKTPYGFTRDDGKGFKGGNFASSLRYNFKYYDRMELSFVGEKDYGEPLYYKNKTYGYDHYALSFTLKDINKYLKQMTVGDFRLNFGEGLAMKQSFSLGYLTSGYGAKHAANTVSPFRSTSEYGYNTGIAAKAEAGEFDITLFGSYNPIDFNGKTIQQTGYHRTENEIAYKNNNNLTLGGGNIQYYNKGLIIGLTAFAYHFTDSLQKGNQAYQQYNFEGKDNNIIAVNASYEYKKYIFFTEAVRSMNNAYAELLGLQINFTYKTTLSLVARNYDRQYQNYYADALGYHSNNQNEQGIYADFSRYLNKKLSYFIGADIFRFPFMSYRADKSSYGQKIRMQLEFKPSDKQTLSAYFRLNNHQYNYEVSKNEKQLGNNIVQQLQLKYKYSFSERLSIASRMGYSRSFTHESDKNHGCFVYAELISRSAKGKYALNLRYTYFNTSDYDNRFYVYEYSLPLAYSSAMLYNTGHKFYTVVSFKPTKKFGIYLRYNITRYNHTSEISSGNTLVKGNVQHYLSGQIYYQF
ncbi:MAG: hypothetical protein J6P44_02680 [Bacteroidales bacterium]|nr:hypothetical protein [Bacteroidales bacterium]